MSQYAVIKEDARANLCAHDPDLPGGVSAGYSVEEVVANIHGPIELRVASMIEHGADVPPPASQVVPVEVAS
ncbi:MAG: type II toxin-antitoxin system HicB family antitoxin [Acidimicrobiaceae bacterium]|nr:type II toxin-antitoxin system HicB family antitoxin [Acidimicrobiaceae bacterium]